MPAKLTDAQFIMLLNERNKTKPTLIALEPYQGRHTKIAFQCANGHQYTTTPGNALRSNGCLVCSGKGAKTHSQFEDELNKLNSSRSAKVFPCAGSIYKTAFDNIRVMCDAGHVWEATPSNIINSKHTCRKCSGKSKKTQDGFLAELQEKRPGVTMVGVYTTAHTKTPFMCNVGHMWDCRPIDVLLGSGCPHCLKKGYSQKCISWLNTIAQQENIVIQHAENGGEYKIPGTQFYADGFCKNTNTVYEFYGDVYHGNPTIFSSDEKCHPYNKQQTAKTLYSKTMQREATIKDLGYNVISIWEADYNG